MRAILQKRGLRYIFAANMISMLGSGMNAAAVAWYILQATHSKMALGLFAVLQTLPAMFLLAGIQGGWLIAGSIVGFVYNHIGLGGVLLIDVSSYVVSFLCYFAVRKGRHVVPRPSELRADIVAAETAFGRFLREMHEGIQFVRGNRPLILLGISWALFLGAMLTAVVVTAPLSDQVFHRGAVGYGWLNAGWG